MKNRKNLWKQINGVRSLREIKWWRWVIICNINDKPAKRFTFSLSLSLFLPLFIWRMWVCGTSASIWLWLLVATNYIYWLIIDVKSKWNIKKVCPRNNGQGARAYMNTISDKFTAILNCSIILWWKLCCVSTFVLT